MVTDEQIQQWKRDLAIPKEERGMFYGYIDEAGVLALIEAVERLRGIVRDLAAVEAASSRGQDAGPRDAYGTCMICGCSDISLHEETCAYRRAVEAMK